MMLQDLTNSSLAFHGVPTKIQSQGA